MAATPLDPRLVMADVSQGVVTKVSHRIAPQNSVAHALNLVFDETIGEAEVRGGTSRTGSAAVETGEPIDGLFNFVDSAGGANSALLAVANGTIYKLVGSTWTSSLAGDTADSETHFATFLDAVVRVNGTDAPKSFDGSSWITTGGAFDLANMPTGKYVTIYKDQVVVLNTSSSPDTFEISSIPSGGAVSWTSGNRSITVNPDDGGNITGHGQIGGLLVIFKDDGMFRWNNRATEPDRIIDVGCSSARSISSGGNYLFFFNRHGIWATQGGYPLLISRRVQKWVDAIASSYYASVSGFCDGRYYWCSIGDVTVDSVSYTNVVLRYALDTKVWTVLSYPADPKVFARYKTGGDEVILFGDASSNVAQLDTGTTDFDGSSIAWEIESHQSDFGSRGRTKELMDRVVGYGLDLVDANLSVRAEKDLIPLGSLTGDVTDLRLTKPVRGKYMSFRVTGHSDTGQRFSGIELPKVAISAYGS